jgi:hypothetical protein
LHELADGGQRGTQQLRPRLGRQLYHAHGEYLCPVVSNRNLSHVCVLARAATCPTSRDCCSTHASIRPHTSHMKLVEAFLWSTAPADIFIPAAKLQAPALRPSYRGHWVMDCDWSAQARLNLQLAYFPGRTSFESKSHLRLRLLISRLAPVRG